MKKKTSILILIVFIVILLVIIGIYMLIRGGQPEESESVTPALEQEFTPEVTMPEIPEAPEGETPAPAAEEVIE